MCKDTIKESDIIIRRWGEIFPAKQEIKDVTKEIFGDAKGNWFQRQEPKHNGAQTAKEWQRVVEAAQKKNRNLAKVHYEKLNDGGFQIVALEGFFSSDDIHVRYGKRTLEKYRSQDHAMIKLASNQVNFQTITQPEQRNLIVGDVYTKEQFSALIAEAKLCGATLSRIIKEVKNATKVIEI